MDASYRSQGVEQLATDLAAHRKTHAKKKDETRPTPTLRRLDRPLAEILAPAVDGRATYLVVAAALRMAMTEGKLAPGDLIPKLDELAAWFGVVRSTAQRAVGALASEDLVLRRGTRWVVADS